MNRVELLAPAGDLEKLKVAVHYGADAVYVGGESFSLRTASKNFSTEQLKEGIAFVHAHGRRIYLTLNIIPHDADIRELEAYLQTLKGLELDGLIVSDPGTILAAQRHLPDVPVHLSTQANTTNAYTAEFWHRQGVKRVVLARELSLEELKDLRQNTPPELELECFVHGAMCISYSGRCLLSNYLAGRDANQGACAHPCRWKYALVEEKRPGEYIPVMEEGGGTYFFNSKDLCLIEHLPQLIKAGMGSLKIEGRVKSSYYVATVVRAYRAALDAYLADPAGYRFNPLWMEELQKASHRDFTTGFYSGNAGREAQTYETSSYIRNYDIVAIVKSYDPETGIAVVEQRNHFRQGETLEIMSPDLNDAAFAVDFMTDSDGSPIEVAPHPQQIIRIKTPVAVNPLDIIRKRKEDIHA